MAYTVWYSGRAFADWFVANTVLAGMNLTFQQLAESDASKPRLFHRMPDHLKQVLYLDAPDVVVEKDGEPIFSVEVSEEAGTGHNAFQRFARLAAAVECGIPSLYIYPEAKLISRGASTRWDRINPSIFQALEQLMQIYLTPALLFYYPSFYQAGQGLKAPRQMPDKGLKRATQTRFRGAPIAADPEMAALFAVANLLLSRASSGTTTPTLLNERVISDRRNWMLGEWAAKNGATQVWSPLTATHEIDTTALLSHLSLYAPAGHSFSDTILASRPKTVIYEIDAGFRGDPYTGAFAAIDYLKCRNGKTFEDRDKNLAISWANGLSAFISSQSGSKPSISAKASVDDFISGVATVRHQQHRCLLAAQTYGQVSKEEISRYYMQARYGCSFTKAKEFRIYSYFADAILFADGCIWREG